MRIASPLVKWLGAALGLALATAAYARPRYVPVKSWPQTRPHVNDYGGADVTGIAVGLDGRVYSCQGDPAQVMVWSPEGKYLFRFGRRFLEQPHSVRVDPDGDVWTTDYNTHLVLRFSPDGELRQTYGVEHRPARKLGHFQGPNDVAFARNGDIYVAEGDGDKVSQLRKDGRFIRWWGHRGAGPGAFRFPHSIAVDGEGRVYVADRGNRRIQVFSAEGKFLRQWKPGGSVFSLWITEDQELFVADGKRNKISIFTLDGQRIARFGRAGSGPGELDEPHMICVDEDGDVFVAQASGQRISKYRRAQD
jgi:DNA-binding beta-propeller fold protein YncE